MHRVPVLLGLATLVLILVLAATPQAGATSEAFQVGPDQADTLPGGKEADGILGDFVLRNDRIEAVISSARPNRRANPFTYFDGAPTPGCLYDLTLRGRANDQLTLFAPSGLKGEVSHVRILRDGSTGEAAIETVVGPALNRGIALRHEYRTRDGWPGLLIVTTVRNHTDRPARFDPEDRWSPVVNASSLRGYLVGDAVNPADKAGYAHRWLEIEGFVAPPDEIELAPGAEITYARGLAVGDSPADAYGRLAQRLEGTSMVRGSLRDAEGLAVTTARIDLLIGDRKLAGYPDARGNFEFPLPFGEYPLVITDAGRAPVTNALSVQPDRDSRMELNLGPASRVAFTVRDEEGRSIPCKVQFLGTNGTDSPNLGPANRAHGCLDQYHSAHGDFSVPLPPGDYHIVITRGPEFSHAAQALHLDPGAQATMHATLRRRVDSRGWIAADFHSHSTESGDSTTRVEDRLINLAAEHLEFVPATEHNRILDWTPHVLRLGLSNALLTVPGIELTGAGPHLNSFPLQPLPRTQDAGAPTWHRDPRIDAILLRGHQDADPARWVQINHPDMIENWIDRDGDGRADGGYAGLAGLLDGAETFGFGILTNVPYQLYRTANGRDAAGAQREFVWLQLLNRGLRLPCIAVSDAHGVHESGAGAWRTYIRSSTDDPARIDWREITRHAKAGHAFVTTGPFLEVRTEDGSGPGDTTRANAGVHLKVRVQCTDWMRIDRIQVLVNGRQPPKLNFTRASHPTWFKDGVVQFDRDIGVPLSEDAHLIVVAVGEHETLRIGFGSSAAGRFKPIAYHNPIFVDLDGDGWKPNGDSLDWELPVRRIDPDEVRDLLESRRAKGNEPAP
jgi:hypothetical protein